MKETTRIRTARCCCGDLSITVSGGPERVTVCHCDYCQRRTGNVFQVSCWYYSDQIESRTGTGSVYSGPDNLGIDYTFCSACGSTVYWKYTVLEDALGVTVYGVAVGCFGDSNFPEPELECWASKRHHWIADLEGADSYKENPPMEWRIPQRAAQQAVEPDVE